MPKTMKRVGKILKTNFMKQLLKKLESLNDFRLLDLKQTKGLFGGYSTSYDTSTNNDSSGTNDSSHDNDHSTSND